MTASSPNALRAPETLAPVFVVNVPPGSDCVVHDIGLSGQLSYLLSLIFLRRLIEDLALFSLQFGEGFDVQTKTHLSEG